MQQLSKRPSDFVDGSRLWDRHMELARFGAREDGGVDRPALSPIEAQARAQLVAWGRELGLRPFTDAAANLFLRLDGRDSSLPPVLAGSHIDSQPTGGKFDGVFGVLAGLEAVRAILSRGEKPLRSIEIVAWTNEEGSRFAPGMSGSEAFTGAKSIDALHQVQDAAGITVKDAAKAVLASDVDVPHRPFGFSIAAFVEPHIEQGPILESLAFPLALSPASRVRAVIASGCVARRRMQERLCAPSERMP